MLSQAGLLPLGQPPPDLALNAIYKVDFTRWTLQGGLYKVDFTRWTLQGGLYKVDFTRWTFKGRRVCAPSTW